MDDLNLDEIRAVARELACRAQSDPAFAEKILQDPISTLTTAGLPVDFVEEFLLRTQLSEVQGFQSPSCGLTVLM